MQLTWVERGLRTRFFSINTGQTRPEAGSTFQYRLSEGMIVQLHRLAKVDYTGPGSNDEPESRACISKAFCLGRKLMELNPCALGKPFAPKN